MIASYAGRVNQSWILGFQEHCSHHSVLPGIPDLDEVLHKGRLGHGVIVEQNDWPFPVGSHGPVKGCSETQVLPTKANPDHIRVARLEQFCTTFAWAIVHHDCRSFT